MINTKELRLGNFVLDDENDPCQISVLYSEKKIAFEGYDPEDDIVIEFTHKPDVWLTKVINPIPITSCVLTEKCGFISDESGKHWVGDFELYPIGKGFDYEGKVIITSVHQLQNIYYFLNGSELPVNF